MSFLKEIIAKVGLDGEDFELGAEKVEERAAEMGERVVDEFKEMLAGAFGAELFAEAIHSAIEFGEEIQNTAVRLGVSTTSAQELSFAAKQSGADLGEVATALDRLAKGLTAMEEGTKEGDKFEHALNRLGITAEEVQGKMPDEVFKLISEKLEHMTVTAETTASMLEIFGRAGARLIPMMKDLHENIQEVNDAGLIMPPAVIEQLDQAHKLMNELGLAAKVAGAAIIITGKEATTGLYEYITAFLTLKNVLDTEAGDARAKAMEKTLANQKERNAALAALTQQSTVDYASRTDKQKESEAEKTERLNEDAARRRDARQEKAGSTQDQIEREKKNLAELQSALDRRVKAGTDQGLNGASLRDQIEIGRDHLEQLQKTRLNEVFKKPGGEHHKESNVDSLARIGGSVGGSAENVMVNLQREQVMLTRQLVANTSHTPTTPKQPKAEPSI